MSRMMRFILFIVLLVASVYEAVSENETIPINTVTDQKTAPDVFRNLLNQETMVRLALTRNVDAMMKELLIVKQSLLSAQNENQDMERKIKKLDRENVDLKRLLDEHQKTLTEFNDSFQKVNENFEKVHENASKITENQKQLEIQTEKSIEEHMYNTEKTFTDMKKDIRNTSSTLLNLNKQTKDVTETMLLRMDSSLQVLSDSVGMTIGNVSMGALKSYLNEKVTDIVNEIKVNILETENKNLVLENNMSSLQMFRMNISNIVKETMPTRMTIAFTAAITSSHSSWTGSTLVFPTIITNIGGGYDSSTGIFTSPADANFVFYLALVSYSSYTIRFDIKLNGSSKVRLYLYDSSGNEAGSNQVILSLQKGDQVWVQRYNGQGYYSDSVPCMTFSGFKI